MKPALFFICISLFIDLHSQTGKNYYEQFITDNALKGAHIGVSVFEPATRKYVHAYQSDKYFVPASNIKILTCYSSLRFLGDTVTITGYDSYKREMGRGWAWTDDQELESPFDIVPGIDCGEIWRGHIDSLLRPMMHKSDNFLAELLLEKTGIAKAGKKDLPAIIDTILRELYPHGTEKPSWVDGSGLSRYNLFRPDDFVYVLDRIQKEFGMKRISAIFPTGNNGTLKNYYLQEQEFIFAKTGTLTGVVAFSGYLYTVRNRLFLFSVLVNNYNGRASVVRRRVENFIRELRRNN